MAIKINGSSVITDSQIADLQSCGFGSLTTPPTSGNVVGDTVFLELLNGLATWNGTAWVSNSGLAATGGNQILEEQGRRFHIFTEMDILMLMQVRYRKVR